MWDLDWIMFSLVSHVPLHCLSQFPCLSLWRTVPDKNSLLAFIFCGVVWDLVTSFSSPPSTLTAAASGIDRYGICNYGIIKCKLFFHSKDATEARKEGNVDLSAASTRNAVATGDYSCVSSLFNLVKCWLRLLIERNTEPFTTESFTTVKWFKTHMNSLSKQSLVNMYSVKSWVACVGSNTLRDFRGSRV